MGREVVTVARLTSRQKLRKDFILRKLLDWMVKKAVGRPVKV